MKDKAVLIIHGFAGDIGEVEPLIELFSKNGFDVIAPTLKGHGGTKKDLKNVTYHDWISQVDKQYLDMESKNIVIAGFSMGGLLAMKLAADYSPCSLILLNAPIYYWNFGQIFKNIIRKPVKSLKRYFKHSTGIPVRAMIEFLKLRNSHKKLLNEINVPVFIAQGMDDDTVQIRSAKYIFKNVGANKKLLRYYSNCEHLICRSSGFEKVASDVISFVNESLRLNKLPLATSTPLPPQS